MQITPEVIEHKDFKTSLRGYDKKEVDIFLDEIIEEFEDVLQKNQKLKEEKEILKKEITTEVREDIARYVGKNIKMRIVLGATIAGLEAFFWAIIIIVSAEKMEPGFGIFLSAMLCILRVMQMSMIKEFGND